MPGKQAKKRLEQKQRKAKKALKEAQRDLQDAREAHLWREDAHPSDNTSEVSAARKVLMHRVAQSDKQLLKKGKQQAQKAPRGGRGKHGKYQNDEAKKQRGRNQNQQKGGPPLLVPNQPSTYYAAPDLKTVFAKEDKAVIDKRKLASRVPFTLEHRLRVTTADEASDPRDSHTLEFEALDFPVRPPWKSGISAQALEKQEELYFREWLQNIYNEHSVDSLNHFEHNLLVWKQLWRVCERSDIILVVCDARHPHVGFSPAVYRYIVDILGKPVVIVLSKADLIPSAALTAWHGYFERQYPEVKVVNFSCNPLSDDEKKERVEQEQARQASGVVGEQSLQPLRWKRGMTLVDDLEGIETLEHVCGTLVREANINVRADARVSFSLERNFPKSRHERKHQRMQRAAEGEQDEELDNADVGELDDEGVEELDADATFQMNYKETNYDRTRGGRHLAPARFVTIGTIGQPNAGKSSLINALTGRKVVSVSISPGHTKYLQTIFINPHVRLCDCPGLVFPAAGLPRAWQVVQGTYPIAQVREPYTAIGFLAERLPLETIYNLDIWHERLVKHQDNRMTQRHLTKRNTHSAYNSEEGDEEEEDEEKENEVEGEDEDEETAIPEFSRWSAFTLCEALALRNNYCNKFGSLDPYRAGKEILQDVVGGRVVMCFWPPTTPKGNTSSVNTAEVPISE